MYIIEYIDIEGCVIYMEYTRKLPKVFFTKVRPHVQPSNDSDDKIIPMKFSKEVRDGKHKDKILVNFPKNVENK